jgi:hypothetical protein
VGISLFCVLFPHKFKFIHYKQITDFILNNNEGENLRGPQIPAIARLPEIVLTVSDVLTSHPDELLVSSDC